MFGSRATSTPPVDSRPRWISGPAAKSIFRLRALCIRMPVWPRIRRREHDLWSTRRPARTRPSGAVRSPGRAWQAAFDERYHQTIGSACVVAVNCLTYRSWQLTCATSITRRQHETGLEALLNMATRSETSIRHRAQEAQAFWFAAWGVPAAVSSTVPQQRCRFTLVSVTFRQ